MKRLCDFQETKNKKQKTENKKQKNKKTENKKQKNKKTTEMFIHNPTNAKITNFKCLFIKNPHVVIEQITERIKNLKKKKSR